MEILNQELSNTLCSIIAIGLLKEGAGSKCIYEPEKRQVHESLQHFLEEKFSIAMRLEEMKKEKFREGSIVAQAPRAESEQAQNVNEDLSFLINRIEAKVKEKKIGLDLRGAYIGGLYDTAKLELLGPSDLWLYDSEYRKVSDEIKPAYENAKSVSNSTIEILNSMIGLKLHDRIKLSIKRENLISDDYAEKKLFASVHGMTRSICSNVYNNATILELALGEDTCKVGSCIPCALFMKSYERPASAIHLGRGDNWNFPKNIRTINGGEGLYSKWETLTYKCYTNGKGMIEKYCSGGNDPGCEGKMREWNCVGVTENPETIGKLFLEALTFESSFMEKLNNTFTISA